MWLQLKCHVTAINSIPGQGTKIPHDSWCSQGKKKTSKLRCECFDINLFTKLTSPKGLGLRPKKKVF